MDKIIANKLWWFLNNDKLLDPHQFGFKKGKSTSNNLLYADHITKKSALHRLHHHEVA